MRAHMMNRCNTVMIERDGCPTFYEIYSYGTLVATIEFVVNYGFILNRHWGGYSSTTLRHINAWLDYLGLWAIKTNKSKWLNKEVTVCAP